MGVDELKIQQNPEFVKQYLNKSLFEFLYVIGRGGFGKVWKVRYKKTKQKFALKEMSKVKIIDRKSEKSIKGEREFLGMLHNPFIVNMKCSFQDKDNLYLVMDLFSGGDLRYHICYRRKFSEIQTKFFIACLILGLEYIHGKNIIHRDIKPENLVCDDRGYLAITDFGVAKKNLKDNSSETSGTPGYMAPEVLCAKNHSFCVDFFAIGVMGYEFMFGVRPYLGKNRKEIKEKVLAKQARIHKDDKPRDWSSDSVSFINNMLIRKPENRLGFNGISEIKNHPWFENFEWELLSQKKMESPFRPKYGDNFDKKYCEGVEEIGTETEERYRQYKYEPRYKNLFFNYTCIHLDDGEIDGGKSVINSVKDNQGCSTLTTSSNGSGKIKLRNIGMNRNLYDGGQISNENNLNDKLNSFKSGSQQNIKSLIASELLMNNLNVNNNNNNNNNHYGRRFNIKAKENVLSNPNKNIQNINSVNSINSINSNNDNTSNHCNINSLCQKNNNPFATFSARAISSKNIKKKASFQLFNGNNNNLYHPSNEDKNKIIDITQGKKGKYSEKLEIDSNNNSNNTNKYVNNFFTNRMNATSCASNTLNKRSNNKTLNQMNNNSSNPMRMFRPFPQSDNNIIYDINYPYDQNQRKIKGKKLPELSKNSSIKYMNNFSNLNPSYIEGINVANVNNASAISSLYKKQHMLNHSNSCYKNKIHNINCMKNNMVKYDNSNSYGLPRPISYRTFRNDSFNSFKVSSSDNY